MKINVKLLSLCLVIIAITAGMMSTSNAQDSRNRRDYNGDRRGWMGAHRNPDERHGFLENIWAIPQDVTTGTAHAVGIGRRDDRAYNRDQYRNRMSRRQMNQQQMNQRPMVNNAEGL